MPKITLTTNDAIELEAHIDRALETVTKGSVPGKLLDISDALSDVLKSHKHKVKVTSHKIRALDLGDEFMRKHPRFENLKTVLKEMAEKETENQIRSAQLLEASQSCGDVIISLDEEHEVDIEPVKRGALLDAGVNALIVKQLREVTEK